MDLTRFGYCWGENRGFTRIDADESKPLPLAFGVSARNQRLSAFIRGSKLR